MTTFPPPSWKTVQAVAEPSSGFANGQAVVWQLWLASLHTWPWLSATAQAVLTRPGEATQSPG